MRILVASDTHGNENALLSALVEQPEAKVVFHLGDGAREAEAMAAAFPNRTFYIARGNGDWGVGSGAVEAGLELVAGRRLFYTHGHRYEVKLGLTRVVYAARERGADVLLFGHTHQPLVDYEDGLHLLNPGSLTYGEGTYGVIDITPAGVVPRIVRRCS